MSIRINRSRLKSERLGRGWSQAHLADASGVSLRTVQRLEGSGRAAAPSMMALAAALALPFDALAAPTGGVRRITPLTILADIGPSLERHQRLGFEPIPTEDPGCVGLRAGNTYLILCSAAFMRDDYRAESIAPLIGRTLPYIWVRAVDEARAVYPDLMEETVTRAGTREILVRDGEEWAILAETPR
ncbi:hypothetical protein GCM10007301_49700 [Azorhizobium oxalatiphilum]|uniref:HTH cro/C1-type domain-containing protein n=1 Tax=Azorhizobium oxalatiphilum TaxID=980631 RepID=A0A917CEJ1_9HYPH|nr:helix-turn-helix transcriptional regulator [Azorhizobium oxalatiphilum]GGF83745.1 hypothetical protein GCM10007301_49700 [Azorhizobium oxalatiphilum]